MNKPSFLALGAVACAALLAGCGSGGEDAVDTTPVATTEFTQSGEWKFVLPASGTSLCYDLEAKAAVADCSGTKWDLKVKSGGMTATLWTNGGTSGTGTGGAFGGPFDHTWAELQAWKNGTTDRRAAPSRRPCSSRTRPPACSPARTTSSRPRLSTA